MNSLKYSNWVYNKEETVKMLEQRLSEERIKLAARKQNERKVFFDRFLGTEYISIKGLMSIDARVFNDPESESELDEVRQFINGHGGVIYAGTHRLNYWKRAVEQIRLSVCFDTNLPFEDQIAVLEFIPYMKPSTNGGVSIGIFHDLASVSEIKNPEDAASYEIFIEHKTSRSLLLRKTITGETSAMEFDSPTQLLRYVYMNIKFEKSIELFYSKGAKERPAGSIAKVREWKPFASAAVEEESEQVEDIVATEEDVAAKDALQHIQEHMDAEAKSNEVMPQTTTLAEIAAQVQNDGAVKLTDDTQGCNAWGSVILSTHSKVAPMSPATAQDQATDGVNGSLWESKSNPMLSHAVTALKGDPEVEKKCIDMFNTVTV